MANENKPSAIFGIYSATLNGKNVNLIASDPKREMNHVRISPDKKWIAFTRFNKRNLMGFAMEHKSQYLETEIVLARLDGTGVESLTPPKKKTVNANSYWTPDGKGLIYISNDNPENKFQLNHIDIASRKITRIPTPAGFIPSDPHQVGNLIVFPVIDPGMNKPNTVWIMKADGSDARQLTNPPADESSKQKSKMYPTGDFDPKLSPDGKRVALMRQLSPENWHIIIVDVETGKEKDISPEPTVDAMPEWSSDGKLLVFWHADPKEVTNSGLYIIKPDGSGRKKIPLPRGYFYSMPSFFPGDGSGEDARIIYSARYAPKM